MSRLSEQTYSQETGVEINTPTQQPLVDALMMNLCPESPVVHSANGTPTTVATSTNHNKTKGSSDEEPLAPQFDDATAFVASAHIAQERSLNESGVRHHCFIPAESDQKTNDLHQQHGRMDVNVNSYNVVTHTTTAVAAATAVIDDSDIISDDASSDNTAPPPAQHQHRSVSQTAFTSLPKFGKQGSVSESTTVSPGLKGQSDLQSIPSLASNQRIGPPLTPVHRKNSNSAPHLDNSATMESFDLTQHQDQLIQKTDSDTIRVYLSTEEIDRVVEEGLREKKTQLLVNYVSQRVTAEEFYALFDQFGTLDEARLIRDSKTNKSKGYGFVYYRSYEDAARCLKLMNRFFWHTKCIKISYAHPQRPLHNASSSPKWIHGTTPASRSPTHHRGGLPQSQQSGISPSSLPLQFQQQQNQNPADLHLPHSAAPPPGCVPIHPMVYAMSAQPGAQPVVPRFAEHAGVGLAHVIAPPAGAPQQQQSTTQTTSNTLVVAPDASTVTASNGPPPYSGQK